jgi:hypothetical protein
MTVFRWIIGVIAAVLASGAVLAFVIFIITDIDVWIKRARAWRRLASATALFWFNVEIWRRVVLIAAFWF